jgi:geranylgeranyl transferase type-2 subunit beta
MEQAGYLARLTLLLSDRLAHLPAGVRARHAAYLRAAQLPDGSFPDRECGPDLYYTGFGLRGLALLGELTPEISRRAADYLRSCLTREVSVVDFYSLLYSALLVQFGGNINLFADSPSDWPERVAARLDSFHTTDGGYSKVLGAPGGSTYHTFLVGLCYELLGRKLPRPEEVLKFVVARRRDDGGFVEVSAMRRSGSNPTAAAVGVLQLLDDQYPQLGALTPALRDDVVGFLTGLVSEEGGLQANDRAPLADLLSTFTGTWTLDQLGALDRIDVHAACEYVRGVERPEGGFRGGVWDDGHDVEYTFYGLGALALLSSG